MSKLIEQRESLQCSSTLERIATYFETCSSSRLLLVRYKGISRILSRKETSSARSISRFNQGGKAVLVSMTDNLLDPDRKIAATGEYGGRCAVLRIE